MPNYEVPNDDQVVAALKALGERVTAVQLCNRLVGEGHSIRESQLAIQRAADRGRLEINRDWTLSVAREAVAA
jgi:hypothetical protein